MLLENQLLISDNITSSVRMCGNFEEVEKFIHDNLRYNLTGIERVIIGDFLKKVLPARTFQESEKRRFLIVTDDAMQVHEWGEDQPLLENWVNRGIVYRNAFSEFFGKIAVFHLGDESAPIELSMSRRSSTESLPIFVAEDLWMQQLNSFRDPNIPKVKADLVPYEPSVSTGHSPSSSGYTLKIGDESFRITAKSDLVFCLQTLVGHLLSQELLNLFDVLILHLDIFPREVVSSPVVDYYVDRRKMVYVGGDGTNGTRKLLYAGKLFPAYFSGLSGNVFSVRVGLFEPEVVNILLVRN